MVDSLQAKSVLRRSMNFWNWVRASTYLLHLRYHRAPQPVRRPKNYCHHCEKNVTIKAYFIDHISREHDQLSGKNFQCSACDQVFAQITPHIRKIVFHQYTHSRMTEWKLSNSVVGEMLTAWVLHFKWRNKIWGAYLGAACCPWWLWWPPHRWSTRDSSSPLTTCTPGSLVSRCPHSTSTWDSPSPCFCLAMGSGHQRLVLSS